MSLMRSTLQAVAPTYPEMCFAWECALHGTVLFPQDQPESLAHLWARTISG